MRSMGGSKGGYGQKWTKLVENLGIFRNIQN
jgi:hypothetical protein